MFYQDIAADLLFCLPGFITLLSVLVLALLTGRLKLAKQYQAGSGGEITAPLVSSQLQ